MVEKTPTFVSRVAAEAAEHWDRREGDVEAKQWRDTLFKQVQDPRHVLSELLQNADDCGATIAEVRLDGSIFTFAHDGDDFDESDFRALCRFAWSNKRRLTTTGFRGIGFKSTFSVGDTVELLTPTISVRFHKKRFTVPEPAEGATDTGGRVLVRIRLHDQGRAAIEEQIRVWSQRPASLLFFHSIKSLHLNDREFHVEEDEVILPGAITKLNLTGDGQVRRCIRIRTPSLQIPRECLDELSRERQIGELKEANASLDVVLGPREFAGIYSVLPTGPDLEGSIAINGPFVLQPDRSRITSLATSAMNRWLIDHAGNAIANAIVGWLHHGDDPSANVEAYGLLPSTEGQDDDAEPLWNRLCDAIKEGLAGNDFLLTNDVELRSGGEFFRPPISFYRAWSTEQLKQIFDDDEEAAPLSSLISEANAERLEEWEFCRTISLIRLDWEMSGVAVPRPSSLEGLAHVWAAIYSRMPYTFPKNVPLVPVRGSDLLHVPSQVIRLGREMERRLGDAKHLLEEFTLPIDSEWLALLEDDENPTAVMASAAEFLAALGLKNASPFNRVLEHLAAEANGSPDVLIQIAQVAAKTDTTVSESFPFVTATNMIRPAGAGIAFDQTNLLADLTDSSDSDIWISGRYERFESCTHAEWTSWLAKRSPLLPGPPLESKQTRCWKRHVLHSTIAKRGGQIESIPYKRDDFTIHDHDFSTEVVAAIERDDPDYGWALLLSQILQHPRKHFTDRIFGRVENHSGGNSRQCTVRDFAAAWIDRLRSKACVRDNSGEMRVPSELLLSGAGTQHLLGIEPFVDPALDTPDNQPILVALGCRTNALDWEPLLDAIQKQAAEGAFRAKEVQQWGALDRLAAQLQPDQLEALRHALADTPVIPCDDGARANILEIAISSDPSVPIVRGIHADVSDLSLWRKLRVPAQPLPNQVKEWVESLPAEDALPSRTRAAVRKLLSAHGLAFLTEHGRWLSLDGTLRPVSGFDFVWTGTAPPKGLFTEIASRTADLRMLSDGADSTWEQEDLTRLMTWRLDGTPKIAPDLILTQWLEDLRASLLRLPEELEIPEWAVTRTPLQAGTTAAPLRLVPVAEGRPIGDAEDRKAAWTDNTLILMGSDLASNFEAVADAVAHGLDAQIQRAVKATLGRDSQFVAHYFASHFALSDAPVSIPEPSVQRQPRAEGSDLQGRTLEVPRIATMPSRQVAFGSANGSHVADKVLQEAPPLEAEPSSSSQSQTAIREAPHAADPLESERKPSFERIPDKDVPLREPGAETASASRPSLPDASGLTEPQDRPAHERQPSSEWAPDTDIPLSEPPGATLPRSPRSPPDDPELTEPADPLARIHRSGASPAGRDADEGAAGSQRDARIPTRELYEAHLKATEGSDATLERIEGQTYQASLGARTRTVVLVDGDLSKGLDLRREDWANLEIADDDAALVVRNSAGALHEYPWTLIRQAQDEGRLVRDASAYYVRMKE